MYGGLNDFWKRMGLNIKRVWASSVMCMSFTNISTRNPLTFRFTGRHLVAVSGAVLGMVINMSTLSSPLT